MPSNNAEVATKCFRFGIFFTKSQAAAITDWFPGRQCTSRAMPWELRDDMFRIVAYYRYMEQPDVRKDLEIGTRIEI
jgi:hypothetical protein